MDIRIVKADEWDLPEIIKLQHAVFRKEAEEYNDHELRPMVQSLDELRKEYKTVLYLKAVDENGEIIASTRGYVEDGTSYIGRTFVRADLQGRGIGTRLIRELEALHPAPRYEINASVRRPENIRLYERLGYRRFKEIKNENNSLVYLEKRSG